MIRWVIEGVDETGAWWVGHGANLERSLDGAFQFTRKDVAQVYASAVKARVYEVVFP